MSCPISLGQSRDLSLFKCRMTSLFCEIKSNWQIKTMLFNQNKQGSDQGQKILSLPWAWHSSAPACIRISIVWSQKLPCGRSLLKPCSHLDTYCGSFGFYIWVSAPGTTRLSLMVVYTSEWIQYQPSLRTEEKNGVKTGQYQPSSAGGTHSLPATLQILQNQ